ncbi:MAG: WD40 repeat domain-containing protein [Candidatus Thorarchaeota archaeon]|nr:MAG: WD40 repeat domain-containing protein [Candidatus Thorarchaeota archaeon]
MTEQELSLFLKPQTLRPAASHGSEITRRFAMNRVGRMLAAAIQDKSIRLYDARNCEEIQRMSDDHLCTSIAFSPKGDIVASGSVGRVVKLWDIRTAELLATLEGHSYPILSLAFSPDGDRLVSASGDTTLKIWDTSNYSELATLRGHALYVKTCDWDPNGNRIVSGSVDSTIIEWNPSSGKATKKHEDHRTAVHTLRFTTDGSTMASGSSDNSIIIWDAQGGALKGSRVLLGHLNEVRAVSFSSDGRYLASGSSDKDLYIWSTEDYTIEGEGRTDSEIDGLEWYHDEHSFLSSDGTGAILRWDVLDLASMLAPFESLLKEIESDPQLAQKDALIEKYESLLGQYDEETLKDKRLFYIQWQCKKALGLLKGKTRKLD